MHFSREGNERDALVVNAFSPVSLFVYGADHPSLKSFSAPPSYPQNTKPIHTHESAKEILLDSRH